MSKFVSLIPDKASAFWLWSIAGAVLVALPAHFDQFPFISAAWQHYLEFAAFIYAVVSAKISQNGH